jgi:hypothetical protein
MHALLAVLFGLGAQRLTLVRKHGADAAKREQELETRLANPDRQQMALALDAIAVEVERIGEGQRYLTKVLAERDARSAEGPDTIRPPKPPNG